MEMIGKGDEGRRMGYRGKNKCQKKECGNVYAAHSPTQARSGVKWGFLLDVTLHNSSQGEGSGVNLLRPPYFSIYSDFFSLAAVYSPFVCSSYLSNRCLC